MSNFLRRMTPVAVLLGLAVTMAPGCVVGPGGPGYDAFGPGPDYYEPYGADYGDWGPGFLVGPFGGGGGGRGRMDGGNRPHTFRGAPAGHSAPSIPHSGGGGGGNRGGGGRGGGHGNNDKR
jgi:hypothetical protein